MKRMFFIFMAMCLISVNVSAMTENDSVVFMASSCDFYDDGVVDAPKHECDCEFMSLWKETKVAYRLVLKGNVLVCNNAEHVFKFKPTYTLEQEDIVRDCTYPATDESGTDCTILFADDAITISYKHMKYVYNLKGEKGLR